MSSLKLPDSLTEYPQLTGLSDLLSVNIPSSISVLPKRSFSNCSLLTHIIPDSILEIDESCFEYTGLIEIYVPDCVINIGESCFSQCRDLEKYNCLITLILYQ